jgi:hypothetical protein
MGRPGGRDPFEDAESFILTVPPVAIKITNHVFPP